MRSTPALQILKTILICWEYFFCTNDEFYHSYPNILEKKKTTTSDYHKTKVSIHSVREFILSPEKTNMSFINKDIIIAFIKSLSKMPCW